MICPVHRLIQSVLLKVAVGEGRLRLDLQGKSPSRGLQESVRPLQFLDGAMEIPLGIACAAIRPKLGGQSS